MTSKYQIGDYVGELMVREVILKTDGLWEYCAAATCFDEQVLYTERQLEGMK